MILTDSCIAPYTDGLIDGCFYKRETGDKKWFLYAEY